MTEPLPSPEELEEQARRQRAQNERQRLANEIIAKLEQLPEKLAAVAIRSLVMSAWTEGSPMGVVLAKEASRAYARITGR